MSRGEGTRRVLGGYSALVYLFLYLPIVVLIVFSFNAARQTAVLTPRAPPIAARSTSAARPPLLLAARMRGDQARWVSPPTWRTCENHNSSRDIPAQRRAAARGRAPAGAGALTRRAEGELQPKPRRAPGRYARG